MLVLEKSDFLVLPIMQQKLKNYLFSFPFQNLQTYIFAFGIKDTSIYFKGDKCNIDLEIANFVPFAQTKNHPIIFIGYAKNKKERKKMYKCLTKWFGNFPIIFLKSKQPGLVLELISRQYQSKIAYVDSKASNIINVSQYVPAIDLFTIHYIAHSKKYKYGIRSISQLYMYV